MNTPTKQLSPVPVAGLCGLDTLLAGDRGGEIGGRMETYNPATLSKVKEALAWAYRSGYSFAEEAAEELAAEIGMEVYKVDLGQYGDTLGFRAKGGAL